MIHSVLTILRTYPACDIERKGDKYVLRRQVNPAELSEELLKSYASLHGDLLIVPKKMIGNSPSRQENEAITIPRESLMTPTRSQPLSGVDQLPVHSGGGSNDMYRIMYDREREESKEYKKKYEDTLSELRRLEVELAGKQPNVVGDIVKGLAGFAPLLMGGGGALSLGSAPQQENAAQQGMQPISDKRISAIVGYWPKMDETMRESIYRIVAAILTNPSSAETVLSLLNESQTPKD